MKYFLIAGEASGDLHGSNLMKGIKLVDPDALFQFFGGDLMLEVGGKLIRHYKNMAFMGGWDVLKNIRTISRNFKTCKEEIIAFQPDVLILIDYAGFNLRMAKFAYHINLPVYYYISPKIWAWKKSRIHKIKKYVNRMFVIFPFEVDFYKKNHFEVEYEGNPTIDSINNIISSQPDFQTFAKNYNLPDKQIIALLAGSRYQEIQRCLPEMVKVAKQYRQFQFVIAGAPSIKPEVYKKYLNGIEIPIVYDNTYGLLKHAKSAIVVSGTATLETAIINTPQVVIYKTGPITFFIGRLIVNIKFFSLVNLILDREVVKELLQYNIAKDAKYEMDKILYNEAHRARILSGYQQIREKLGKPGSSERVARLMYRYLDKL